MPEYNGHKDHAHWNVALWLFNEEPLYRMMQWCVKEADTLDIAAEAILHRLKKGREVAETPDGVPYSVTTIRAALEDWEDDAS